MTLIGRLYKTWELSETPMQGYLNSLSFMYLILMSSWVNSNLRFLKWFILFALLLYFFQFVHSIFTILMFLLKESYMMQNFT